MKRAIQCCFVLVVLLAISPVHAAETLVLYDNFKGANINPDKWFGSESSGGRETLRAIANGQLHISDRLYGNTATNSGSWSGSQRLHFMNPENIRTIKATVMVGNFQTVGCDANPGYYSYAGAYIQGYFFNTSTMPPTPGDSTNDVIAKIGISAGTNTQTQPPKPRVDCRVQRCNDPQCNTSTTIAFHDFGGIDVGQKVTLYLKWDKVKHRFIFRRDKQAAFYSPYDVSVYHDTSPPGYNGKRLRIEGAAANCTDSPRPVGSMDAFFDNVYINK